MARFSVLVCAVLLVLAGPASAVWMQSPTPTISGETSSTLEGVSCSTPSQCIAVGGYADSSGHNRILAESWDGSAWTTMSTTDPFGSAGANLHTLNCTSATSCMAVGSYVDSGGNTLPIADQWDGSTWTLWAGTLPNGAVGGEYVGVKCVSSSSCFAVGDWTNGSTVTRAFVGQWDATSWSVMTTPPVSGASESDLDAIACPTSTSCLAVGQYRDTSNNSRTLAESWNGSAWTVVPTPNPAGSSLNELNGIACSTPTLCMAVGSGFAEQWNGASWSVLPIATPHPHTGGAPALFGVSCRGAAECVAVGYYELDAVQTRVAEIWDGARWVLQSTPVSSPNDSSFLHAVSCTSPASCTAVGSYHNSFFNHDHTLAESFSLAWQQQNFTSPGPSISGYIGDVSCPTITFCAAVGNFESSSDFETYAEVLTSFGWGDTPVPNPSTTFLSGVSCTSSAACTAVGNGGDATNGFVTLAERWDGHHWAAQSTPNHGGGGQGSYFLGVSCSGARFCMAVGAYRGSSGHQFPYAARWNGTTWAATAVPNPSGGTLSQLNRVSCTSASSCVAVGNQSGSGSTALAEVWNGSTWTVQSPVFTGGLVNASLQDVSCLSATSCVAVGAVFSTAANREFAVAESWNGTAWTDMGALSPSGTRTDFLNGVSCVAADDCEAVGTQQTRTSAPTTLVEGWNGSRWAVQSAPNPGGANTTALTAVACPSRVVCRAVGRYSQTNGNDDFLVETYS